MKELFNEGFRQGVEITLELEFIAILFVLLGYTIAKQIG